MAFYEVAHLKPSYGAISRAQRYICMGNFYQFFGWVPEMDRYMSHKVIPNLIASEYATITAVMCNM